MSSVFFSFECIYIISYAMSVILITIGPLRAKFGHFGSVISGPKKTSEGCVEMDDPWQLCRSIDPLTFHSQETVIIFHCNIGYC